MDLRPTIESALDAFSVDAVVTPPGGAAVETRAIWLPPTSVEHPVGSEARRAELRRVIALPLAGLPQVPRGTVVSAPPEEGADPADWRIEDAERVDFDHYRAVVVPA